MSQTIKIDFQVIESNTPKFLIVGDMSKWEYAQNLPSYIEITLPGSKTPNSFTFNKASLNSFNSHNLKISCLTADCVDDEEYQDLPDGIYTICVKSGFETIEKLAYYLKTDVFDLEKDKTIVKHLLDYSPDNKKLRNAILDTDWFETVAKSFAKEGNFVEANRYYNEAVKLLNSLNECK